MNRKPLDTKDAVYIAAILAEAGRLASLKDEDKSIDDKDIQQARNAWVKVKNYYLAQIKR